MVPKTFVSAWLIALICTVCAAVGCSDAGQFSPGGAPLSAGSRAVDERQRMVQAHPYPAGFDPAATRILAARQLDQLTKEQLGGAATQAWVPIGPSPTLDGSQRYGAWTSSLAVDPSDTTSNTVFIGNPGSGVWKTTNGGTTWVPKGDSAPALAIGAIAVAPSNANVIYAGTGDWFDGVGLLKSVDKGETWSLLPGAFSTLRGSNDFWSAGLIFRSLAVSPTDPNTVLAGVWYGTESMAGIYRSTDGGSTWGPTAGGSTWGQPVFSGGKPTSIVWDPSNASVAYAAIGDFYSPGKNGIYKSTDGGVTWSSSSNGIPQSFFPLSQEITLSISHSNPNVLYASIPCLNNQAPPICVSNNGGTIGVFKTTDGGANWVQLPAPNSQRAFLVVVHPSDSNTVLVGDTRLHRSVDGGMMWDDITGGANGVWTFGDYRSFAFSADGSTLYIGSDGGVFKTNDARSSTVNWTELNDTLDTVLFYPRSPFSMHPTDKTITFGGTQDLGILRYSGGQWTRAYSYCDAGTTLIDFNNTNNVYGACSSKQFYRSTQAGVPGSFFLAMNGINTNDRMSWIPPIAIDKTSRLLFGTYRIYKSTDGASTWSPISPDVTSPCAGGVTTTISVSPADPNYVYVGSLCDSLYVSTNSLSPSPSWAPAPPNSGLPQSRDLNAVVADPANKLAAYALYGGFTFGSDTKGHVFKTVDAGMTWKDISANLPNIPANHLAVDPALPGTLYLATDVGMFQTTNGGQTWTGLSAGLPHAYVNAVVLHGPTRTLRIATFGRGMWDLLLPLATVTLQPVADAYVRDGGSAGTNFGTATVLLVKNTPTTGYNRRSFLKFDITAAGGTVSNAKLRLFGSHATAGTTFDSSFAVSNNTWTETGIIWNNQPALGAKQGASVGITTTAQYYEFDVTAFVQSQKAAGINLVSLAITMDSKTDNGPDSFNSREATTNPPQLVVTSN
jgi:photosystem II stability/assembly factor-like uncharacterized protein